MRLSNRNKAAYFQFLYIAVLLLLASGAIAFILERYVYHFLGKSEFLLLITPIMIAFIFYLRGRQFFEYDSDGETLNFKNRSVLFSLKRVISDEYPKYKVLDFEIVDMLILKRLYITISSKKNKSIILKYDISYLRKREVLDLKKSLVKVVSNNQNSKSEKNS